MFRETIFYKKKSKWNGMYFASFDFKYQKSEKNYKLLENIGNYVDVIVTSGTATGEKTQVEKLLAIYENIGDKKIPICAASGVSIENIEEYKKVPGDVYIICSTYVSLNFYELDANKVKQLIKFRLLS
jgi:predicted TIM-barrel enzyme